MCVCVCVCVCVRACVCVCVHYSVGAPHLDFMSLFPFFVNAKSDILGDVNLKRRLLEYFAFPASFFVGIKGMKILYGKML
jgi:hypothetical protein